MSPFRLNEFRTKIQFLAPARMPSLVYKACLATGMVSNTVYIQHAVCEALARDLGMDLQELLDDLPIPRTAANTLRDPTKGVAADQSGGVVRIGPGNTIEEVR